MSNLQDRIAQLKARNKAGLANKSVPAVKPSTPAVKQETFNTSDKKDMGNLLNQVQQQSSKVSELIAKREEEGAYTLANTDSLPATFDQPMFLDSLRALDIATVEKTPEIPSLCIALRKNLEQYPELTHILTDVQIGIIVGGYLSKANVETAPKTTQSKARKTAQEAKNLNLDNLF